jgi:DNA-binding MarR family transcriptional regulator
MSRELPAALSDRMTPLLKHALLGLAELTGAALEPYGINGQELAVLTVLASGEMLSQQQAAQRLSVDRTTMVALIDSLEEKGLVERHPHPEDRRKNVVDLTEEGDETLQAAGMASREAERRFLEPLDEGEVGRLKESLRMLISAAPAHGQASGHGHAPSHGHAPARKP